MKLKVFYSWQSDLPNSTNRGFIEEALSRALRDLSRDASVEARPELDSSLVGVPGAPDIENTIFQKIDRTQVFVCDISITNRSSGTRPTPNPNVLIELGYAMKILGVEKIVLVINSATLNRDEDIPFDIRGKRYISYYVPVPPKQIHWRLLKKFRGWAQSTFKLQWSRPRSRPDERRDLERKLKEALSGIVAKLEIQAFYEDPVENLWTEFDRHTTIALDGIRVNIPGVAHPVERPEIANIQGQLDQRKSVIFTGEAGTGKSGIAAILAYSARSAGKAVFLLDARKVGYIRSEAELRQYIPVAEPVSTAIRRIGDWKKGSLVIIDQLDNIAGSTAAETLIDFAVECSQLENSSVVVISRKREAHEIRLFQRLNERGFVELTSHHLDSDSVLRILKELGINSPLHELLELGSNLLNLELIGLIKKRQPDFDFTSTHHEVDLWYEYFYVLIEHDRLAGENFQSGEAIMTDAKQLARNGIMRPDRRFLLPEPLLYSHQRLISWEIITCEEGVVYRFRHEKLQDFLYSVHATERQMMPQDVMAEIDVYRTKNVFIWMDNIYSRNKSPVREDFVREMLLHAE